MRSNYKRLGDHIQEVNVRNSGLKINNLLGINIDKYFMPSVANIVGTDMTTYKVVKNGQFACNRMHVGRDRRLPVALSTQDEDIIVSPAYNVFEIVNTDILLPEYLMMWFSRKEFDRNAWFYTDADVRGGLNWNDFCDMQLPIPSIAKQKEIVKEYNVLLDRINLNNQLIQKLEETALTIYKQWFVDFEFPDENHKPYKSNGGIIEIRDNREIPSNWEYKPFEEISFIQNGFAFKSKDYVANGCKMIRTTDINKYGYIDDSEAIFLPLQFYYDKKYENFRFQEFDVVLVMVGASVGKIGLITKNNLPSLQNQNMWRFRPKKNSIAKSYIFHTVREINSQIKSQASGSARDFYTKDLFQKHKVLIPSERVSFEYKKISDLILAKIGEHVFENMCLNEILQVLLCKLSKDL